MSTEITIGLMSAAVWLIVGVFIGQMWAAP